MYVPILKCMAGGKESKIKSDDGVGLPQTKRKRTSQKATGCRFYKSTALGNFSDLALVRLSLQYTQ